MARKKVRYAVAGLGHIAQAAVLPAFEHASKNSELVALVSDDARKLRQLSRKYRVEFGGNYRQFENVLAESEADAVYIALPNHMHAEYTVRAAKAGVHVLCEKPMAVTERECEEMIRLCAKLRRKLMIAYRLHFEKVNLEAVESVQSGKIGEPKLFSSVFTMDVKAGDIRLRRDTGGGTLYDIGIYCINAARYLFRDEPVEVLAASGNTGEARFREVDEMTSATLRFPGDRLAQFITSFGSAGVMQYRVVGTKGDLEVQNAYDYDNEMTQRLTVNGKTREKTFAASDQFGPELVYFSDCILRDREPEPSGEEGLIDVKIIRALYRSAENGRPVKLDLPAKRIRPAMKQEIRRPRVRERQLVKTRPPTAA